ncbi:MAG TPA: hypothetical protein VMJ35_10035 [Dongiaceae bacterium]|nr:hypothetical protein [Dongiaceae bacterium]
MSALQAVSMLGLFSKLYVVAMVLLLLFYVARHSVLHAKLARLREPGSSSFSPTIELIRDHTAGLREAEHIALGSGRALFAAQLSQLLVLFTPLMRSTDAQPWFDVPNFIIICQLCFLPVLLLLVLDWALSGHLRRVIRRR